MDRRLGHAPYNLAMGIPHIRQHPMLRLQDKRCLKLLHCFLLADFSHSQCIEAVIPAPNRAHILLGHQHGIMLIYIFRVHKAGPEIVPGNSCKFSCFLIRLLIFRQITEEFVPLCFDRFHFFFWTNRQYNRFRLYKRQGQRHQDMSVFTAYV